MDDKKKLGETVLIEEKIILLDDDLQEYEPTFKLVEINTSIIYGIMKRLTDIIGAAIGLLILSPVFLLLFLLMKIENNKADFIFSQVRVGKNQKKFRMYKIRSMCPDAEEKLKDLLDQNEVEGAMFKMKDDPRITKIGKFIRKYSLDELPQLWNVLKGDMSLVGPRPPLEREVKEYKYYDLQRLLVKPGCTGLWQISGRNDVGFHDMVDLDIKYIREQGLKNDVVIILKTVMVMLKPNGAY